LVTASADPSFGEGLESPAKVRVTFKDGQSIEARRDYATGTNQAPMSRMQLEEKFFDSAAQAVSPETARKILVVLNTLVERPSLDEFWPLVRVG